MKIRLCISPLLVGLATGLPFDTQGAAMEYVFSTESFYSRYGANEDGLFNPGNLFAQLPEHQFDAVAKLKAGYRDDGFKAWISPRLVYEWYEVNGRNEDELEGYIQDWGIQVTPSASWVLSYGRDLLFWGPSLFTSPSNPFFSSVNQSNPFIELPGRDFLRVRYTPNTNFALSLIVNSRLGRDVNEYDDFKPIAALKADINQEKFSAGFIAARRERISHFGMFGQWTLSDAWLAYVDLGMRNRSDARVPTGSAAVGGGFIKRPSRREYDAILGSAYTFDEGSTLSLELRHNSQGLDDDENAALRQQLFQANQNLADPVSQAEAAQVLAVASDLKTRSLRRNYIHAQFLTREVTDGLSLNLLALHGVDDGSTQWIGVANYYLTEKIRLSADVLINTGGRDSEFRRYFDHAVFAGIKYFF